MKRIIRSVFNVLLAGSNGLAMDLEDYPTMFDDDVRIIVGKIAAAQDVVGVSDIVGSLSGKTIEIISTDAEGRMVMADGIAYARKLGVKKIIDVATLTGACIAALGDAASGIMGSDQQLIDQMIAAGQQSGEKLWQLPLFEEYKDYSKSEVADIKNCTQQGKAGPSIGGLFLRLFAEDTAWVHLDIAGTAFLDKGRHYLSSGATGAMVRTLTRYLMG